MWPNSTIPKNGDNVIIPSSWVVILDIDTNELGTLEINGRLKFNDSRNISKLTAKIIWIRGGILEAGNET